MVPMTVPLVVIDNPVVPKTLEVVLLRGKQKSDDKGIMVVELLVVLLVVVVVMVLLMGIIGLEEQAGTFKVDAEMSQQVSP